MTYKHIIETGSDIPIPESYTDCYRLIQSDYYRHYGKVDCLLKMFKAMVTNMGFRYSFWMRLCAHRGALYPFTRLMQIRTSNKSGIIFSSTQLIGWGFYIGHGVGTISNETVIIGNNCNVGQFTTFGTNHNSGAIIGDNVYIGPSVCLVERVIIGSYSVVGAGAVVTKDVKENTTVAGVPAAKISDNNSSCYIQNPWNENS